MGEIEAGQTAWAEFRSTTCPACLGPKKKSNGFCAQCYFSLPQPMRNLLWKRFGEGYEDAHNKAKQWLWEHK